MCGLHSAGGEAHHEEGIGGGTCGVGDGWSGGVKDEIAEVLLVENYGIAGNVTFIGTADKVAADGDLSREANDFGANAVPDKGGDTGVDITWVRRV